jgi:zinc protease
MIDRTRKPVEQIDFVFHPPFIDQFTLDSGLKVYFIERPYLPVLRISLLINAGSINDPSDKKGLANLLTMTFDEGAGNLNGLELSDELELLGSNFDSGCNHDNIFLSLRSLKENFDRSLELFSDILLKPHLDEISFAREKRKILTRVMQFKDEPDEIANQVFESVIFGKDDPYSFPIPGTEESITNIKSEDVKTFYNNYVLPGNSALVVVGDIKRDQLILKLNNYLNTWKDAPVPEIPLNKAAKNKNRIFIVHKEDAVQTEIRAGHLSVKRNHPDYMAKLMLNNILGGQFSSRINLNLRERNGYTYGASSSFSYHRERGYFIVSTSVGKQNSVNALKEIIKELENVRNGVTPEELSFTRSAIVRKFPSNFESNKQIAINTSRIILHSLPSDHYDKYIETVNKLTLQDINKAAGKYIYPDKLTVVLVGDKNILIPQLEEAGLNNITELDYKGDRL